MSDNLLKNYKTDIHNMITDNESLELLSVVTKSASIDLTDTDFIVLNTYILAQIRQSGYNNGVSSTKEEIKRLINEEL